MEVVFLLLGGYVGHIFIGGGGNGDGDKKNRINTSKKKKRRAKLTLTNYKGKRGTFDSSSSSSSNISSSSSSGSISGSRPMSKGQRSYAKALADIERKAQGGHYDEIEKEDEDVPPVKKKKNKKKKKKKKITKILTYKQRQQLKTNSLEKNLKELLTQLKEQNEMQVEELKHFIKIHQECQRELLQLKKILRQKEKEEEVRKRRIVSSDDVVDLTYRGREV